MARALNGALIEFPNGIDHRMVMSVEDVFFEFRVARDVDLRYTLRGNAVHISEGIETMISRGNINIVDIQENPAVSPLHHFVEKLPFRHFRDVKFCVAADILDGDGHFKKVAHLADLLSRKACRFESVGHGKEIVRVTPVYTSPTQMVREPRRFRPLHQLLQPPQVLAVWLP